MNNASLYQLLADIVLAMHAGVVLFVIGGLVIIIVGNVLGWQRVNNIWFRALHISAIGVVMLQTMLGALCPLTYLEMWLRDQANVETYSGSFFQHWLQQLIYFDLPSWAFMVGYALFALMVVVIWFVYPPAYKNKK